MIFFHILLHLQCGICLCLHPLLTGVPKICEAGLDRTLSTFSSTFMQISSSSIWERGSLSLCLRISAVAGGCCFWHMASGRGSVKWTKQSFLKWLLASLLKIGDLRADREASGICNNSHSTLQFWITQLSLNFLFNFLRSSPEKNNPNKQKTCRSFKSQVAHLNN